MIEIPRRSGIELPPGNVHVEVNDAESGKLLGYERTCNRVVANGRDALVDLLANVGGAPNYIAVGTGSTAPDDTDAALETEVFRNAITRVKTQPSRCVYQLYILDTQGNGYTWQEIGLFVGTSRVYTTTAGGTPLYGGTLVARANISPLAKTSLVTVTITWELPVQSAS